MRKSIPAVLFALAMAASFSSSVLADEGHAIDHARGGLGFRSTDAPIGIRWWLSDMIAVDAGVLVGGSDAQARDASAAATISARMVDTPRQS